VIEPRYRWSLKPRVVPGVDLVDAAVERGFGRVAIALLAGRGVATADDLARFVSRPSMGSTTRRSCPMPGGPSIGSSQPGQPGSG
jgi:hypothetical protein